MRQLFDIEVMRLDRQGLEFAGRNCRDAIRVGQKLCLQGSPASVFEVTAIELYHKNVEELPHGCVGTLYVLKLEGDNPRLGDRLVNRQ